VPIQQSDGITRMCPICFVGYMTGGTPYGSQATVMPPSQDVTPEKVARDWVQPPFAAAHEVWKWHDSDVSTDLTQVRSLG
jgi:hypothetical protein